MRWFSRLHREPGWMVLAVRDGELTFAHGEQDARGHSVIRRCGTVTVGQDEHGLQRAGQELHLGAYQCATLLEPSQYQLLQVEAPAVPAAELKAAVRWRIKDMLDFHVDDATVDVLDVPGDASAAGRGHAMYAVAARNEVIQETVDRYMGAGIPLSVIDIQETAQRNIAALFEEPERGVALLYLGPRSGLLTVTFHGELHFARRLDTGLDHVAGGEQGEEAVQRLVLELQRTFDHFDRQYRHVSIGRLLVGPEPHDTGLARRLVAELDLPVQPVHLADVVSFESMALAPEDEWRLFHLLGASLRREEKAL